MTRFKHLVEIGAGDRYSSEGLAWALKENGAERVTLYEPNSLLCADLTTYVTERGLSNVTVHEQAVTPVYEPLYMFGYASFLHGAPSFLATSVEEGYEKWWGQLAREVSCVKVDRMDWGTREYSTIDGLILTINGGESAILERLMSRPQTVWTKHYLHNQRQWQDFARTAGWFERNGYIQIIRATNQHHTFFHCEWQLTRDFNPSLVRA